MRTLGQLLAGRLAIALAIVFAVLSAPTGSSAFHDAAAKGHVSMAVLDDHDHGHSHDVDDEPADAGSTDTADDHHKHNPGDHSHEKLGVPPEFASPVASTSRTRLLTLGDAALPSLSSTLDRPPRPSRIA
ncbi:hypothetical protein [uncultured Aureimonas sp.]|uniref:hypothetical protein n=1 Tax=uncultured Aureimonas sp. TaxID=1604662 RepID=UPI0025E992F1|nr:hypothetical protein [uncultured Aureimonas sp.]